MDDVDFRRFLEENEGMDIRTIPGDGNCLYSALALALRGNVDLQMEIRQEIAASMRSNPLPYIDFANNDNEDFQTAVQLTFTNGEWGGHLQLQAASDYYRRNIVVYTPDGRKTQIPEDRHYSRTIYLSFHNGNHFNLLKKKITSNLSNDSGTDEESNMNTSESEYDSSNDNSGADFLHQFEDADSNQSEMGSMNDNSESENFNDVEHLEAAQDDAVNQDVNGEKGFEYLACKVYSCGRNFVYLMMLIPTNFECATLSDSIHNAAGRAPMFFTVSYTPAIHKTLQTNFDIKKQFNVWVAKKTFPLGNNKISIRAWYCQMLLPYVLFTVMNLKWTGETMKFLFLGEENSLVPSLIKDWWKSNQITIKEDFRLIMNNPDCLFCDKCTYECHFRMKPWHINLEDFELNIDSPNNNTCIFARMNSIQTGSKFPGKFLDQFVTLLNEIYLSNENLSKEEKLLRAYQVLDGTSRDRKQYCSYLLLILDGHNMKSDTRIEDVLNDKSYFKSLYAGQTCDGDYRKEHFQTYFKSPVARIFSSTSKVYLLRSKKFTTRSAVTHDESIVIEILKLTIETAKQNARHPPFILLNKKSENSNLFRTVPDTQKKILDFCNKETPIFTINSEESGNYMTEEFFEGNYFVGSPLNLPQSTKTFSNDLYLRFIN